MERAGNTMLDAQGTSTYLNSDAAVVNITVAWNTFLEVIGNGTPLTCMCAIYNLCLMCTQVHVP